MGSSTRCQRRDASKRDTAEDDISKEKENHSTEKNDGQSSTKTGYMRE